MALDLNVSPYYDDYNSSKQFDQILFKPGVAVQARELTQLQTYLHKAIANHAGFNVTEGTRVTGGEGSILRKPYIKINDTDASAAAVSNSTLANYVGDTITGSVTGIQAIILSAYTGSDGEVYNKKTFYLRYIGGNTQGTTSGELNGSSIHFDPGETLTVTSADSDRNGDTFVVDANVDTPGTDISKNFHGYGLFFAIAEGVFFLKGRFVNHLRQEVLVDKYNPLASSFIGLTVTEEIVDSDDDSTLLDPAAGSYNYNAPGADRYKISTTIGIKALTDAATEDFIVTDKIVEGTYNQKMPDGMKQLADLGKIFAQRTHEESGNYVVRPFKLTIQEHLKVGANGGRYTSGTSPVGSATKLVANIGAGTAYVSGYRYDFATPTPLSFDKGNDTRIIENSITSTASGQYVIVDEMAGNWSLSDGAVVQIYDGSATSGIGKQAITNNTHGTTAKPVDTSIIGQARVKFIEKIGSGTVGGAKTQYRLYLYDVKVNTGSFDTARGFVYGSGNDKGLCDIVLEPPGNAVGVQFEGNTTYAIGTFVVHGQNTYQVLATGTSHASTKPTHTSSNATNGTLDLGYVNSAIAVLKEKDKGRLLFPAPFSSPKTLAAAGGGSYDTSYQYQEEFSVSIDAAGQFSISVTSPLTFPYGVSMTQTVCDSNFYMVLTGGGITINGTAYAQGAVVPLTAAMFTSVSSSSIAIDLGTVSGTCNAKLKVNVTNTDSVPVTKALNSGVYVKINTASNLGGSTGPWNLGIPDCYKLEEVYVDASAYVTSGTNLIDKFRIKTGQTDELYKQDYLEKLVDAGIDTNNKYITVKLSCFVANYTTSNGTYFAVNSYPIDDTGGSGIYTYQVPVYRRGEMAIDLKNAIDFRPQVKATASVTATTIGAATENPQLTHQLNVPANGGMTGLQNPNPVQNFTTDIEFYLGRMDKIVLTESGEFSVVKGIPSLNAIPPNIPNGTMTIAEVVIPPFPSVAPNIASAIRNPYIGCKFRVEQPKRYTMNDIAAIEKRINRLEYYTALSLMEREADSLTIVDANGNDRFKNGIFINTFISHALSSTKDPSFRAAIDIRRKQLAPAFKEEMIELQYNDTLSTTVQRHDNLLTLPVSDMHGTDKVGYYSANKATWDPAPHGPDVSRVFSRNPMSSHVRNTAGELLFDYAGDMMVHPKSSNDFTQNTLPPEMIEDTSLAQYSAGLADSIQSAQIVQSYDFGFETSTSDEPAEKIGGKAEPATTDLTGSSVYIDKTASWQTKASDRTGNNRMWVEAEVETSGTVSVSGEWGINGTVTTDGEWSADLIKQRTTTTSTATANILQATSGPSGQTSTMDLSGRLKSFAIDAYMRGKELIVVGQRLKPNTPIFCFVEGEYASHLASAGTDSLLKPMQGFFRGETNGGWPTLGYSGHATPMAWLRNIVYFSPQETWIDKLRGANINGPYCADNHTAGCTTDAQGNFVGILKIPDGKYPVGSINIRLCDDRLNRPVLTSSSCEGKYSAFGATSVSQGYTISTEIPAINFSTVQGATIETGSTSHISDVSIKNEKMTLNTTAAAGITVEDFEVGATATSHVELTGGFDPIGQTFTVPTMKYTSANGVVVREPGMFLQELRVFFSTISDTDGITCEIRETLNGYPTRTVLPYASVTLDPNIHTVARYTLGQYVDSSDATQTDTDLIGREGCLTTTTEASNGTVTQLDKHSIFKFNDPIFLKAGTEYAFVLKPQGNSTDYNVWCSKLGENVINTKTRITADDTNIGGLLFTSSNNGAWNAHQSEDITYELIRSKFANTSGNAVFTNKNYDFMTVTNYSAGFPKIGDKVYAFDPAVNGAGSGYQDGDIITLATVTDANGNTATGIKLQVTGPSTPGAITGIKVSDPGVVSDDFSGTFSAVAQASIASGTGSGGGASAGSGSSATFNLTLARGFVEDMDIVNSKITVRTIANYFKNQSTGAVLTPISNSATARTYFDVTSMDNKLINEIKPTIGMIDLPGTSITGSTATTNSSGASAANTSSFRTIEKQTRQNQDVEKAIYSYSTEAKDFTGSDKKSFRYKANLQALGTDRVSPVISLTRNSCLIKSNDINNDATNETGNYGNARSVFVNKPVELKEGMEAEDILVQLVESLPSGSDIKVYGKFMAPDDDADWTEDLNWIELATDDKFTDVSVAAKNSGQWIDYAYKIPAANLNTDGQYTYSTVRVISLALNGVKSVTITNGGSGYTSDPTVAFAAPTSGGIQATGTATRAGAAVSGVVITNPGSNYGSAPSVTFSGGGGSSAAGTAVLCQGGSGYTSAPDLSFSTGDATAQSILSGGSVGEVAITNPGRDYTLLSPPTVTVGTAWQASTVFATGQQVTNDSGKLYTCSTGGTSAGSGGPTGTGGSISDGTCVWAHAGTAATVAATTGTVNFVKYRRFGIKIVMLSSNTSNIPVAKELRAIALMA